MPDLTPELRAERDATIAAYSRIVHPWAEAWNDVNEAAHAPCRELFLEYLSGRRILDVGCGLGRDSLFFAEAGYSVTATDIVPAFLPPIRNAHPGIDCVVMDMTAPCLAAGTFDGVYLFASFLHVPHAVSLATLTGLHALLKPGGTLCMQHVQSDTGHRSYRVDNLLIDDNPAYCYCHGEDDLVALLGAAGFVECSLHHRTASIPRSALAERLGLIAYQVVAKRPTI